MLQLVFPQQPRNLCANIVEAEQRKSLMLLRSTDYLSPKNRHIGSYGFFGKHIKSENMGRIPQIDECSPQMTVCSPSTYPEVRSDMLIYQIQTG